MTAPDSDRESLEAEARRALYGTGDPIVAPGGIPPRWGCSLVAHEKLGWCASCRGIVGHVEALGWRLWASGQPQTVDWARAVTREAQ